MHRIASLLLLTVVAMATSPRVWAADPGELRISFETRRGHLIVVEAQVEGLPLQALIDTGANRSVIDTRIAERLGINRVSSVVAAFGKTSTVDQAIVRNLRIGPIHTAAVVLVADLSDWGVDAIIGMEVLGRSDFGIDFETEEIVFEPTETLPESVPFDLEQSLAIVTLEVRGQPVRLSVDTGAAGITLHQTDRLSQIVRSPLTRSVRTSNFTGAATVTEVRLREVRLGSSLWRELRANVTSAPPLEGVDKLGVLSVASLGLKRIQFDFERGVFSWEK